MLRIIISPAKRMRAEDTLPWEDLPRFLPQAQQLLCHLRALAPAELRRLLACNEEIAALNYSRFQHMDLRRGLSPALLCYDGIQYQTMAPQIFETAQLAYVQRHLFILSGFYGALRPFDGVAAYRLEMQAKLNAPFAKDLYTFWGDAPARAIWQPGDVLLDLASAEYSRAVVPHLPAGARRVRCRFAQEAADRLVEKGVYVKMARGALVRWMAERGVARAEDVQTFDGLGYRYQPARSSPEEYVFLRP